MIGGMTRRSVAAVDASFWIHAGMVRNHHELLGEFDLTVPTTVARELGAPDSAPSSLSGQALKVSLDAGNARIMDPKGPLIAEFHSGEKAVLTLAIEQKPDLVPLIDETKAYTWAAKKSLPVLSMPLWLALRSVSGAEDALTAISKIKALVAAKHVSMAVAHEPLVLLAGQLAREGRA